MDDFREKKIEADKRRGFYSEEKIVNESTMKKELREYRSFMKDELRKNIREFDKSVHCLAIELPEPVWNDVNAKWQKIRVILISLF